MQKRSPMLVARMFLSDSRRFLEAARAVQDTARAIMMTGPTNYLVCHSIELALKSFILARGGTEAEILRIAHDLTKALQRATELGFVPVDSRTEGIIKVMAPLHQTHRFRYARTGLTLTPRFDVLFDVTQSLVDQIDQTLKA